jgi:hypothetical protein
MKERRKAHRYGLCLPVNIRAPIDNDPMSLHGETLDISTRGVYFTVANELKVGMKLGLTMTVGVHPKTLCPSLGPILVGNRCKR